LGSIGISCFNMVEIYQPAEDSYFFSEFLRDYLSQNFVGSYLDMGTGSGILAEVASEFVGKENILAADINSDAVKLLKRKGFEAIETDLFSEIPERKKFDLITFNAPYLPEDLREPIDSRLATTGGKRGDEIAVKFLKQAKRHLKRGGKIFLMVSTLTPMDRIKEFGCEVVGRKKIFAEELLILSVSD